MPDAANHKHWRSLAHQVANETDGEKLTGLVGEMCRALDVENAPLNFPKVGLTSNET